MSEQQYQASKSGMLILVGCFKYMKNRNEPREDAILLVADDAVIGPKDKKKKEEFAKGLKGLEGAAKTTYLLENAMIDRRNENKVFKLGNSAEKGAWAFGGNHRVQERLSGYQIARTTDADEAKKWVVNKIAGLNDPLLKGTVVHAQFTKSIGDPRACHVIEFDYDPENPVEPQSEDIFSWKHLRKHKAFGISSHEKFIDDWEKKFFGKTWTREEILTALRELSRKIQSTQYESLLGANFNGFVIVDAPNEEDRFIEINTEEGNE